MTENPQQPPTPPSGQPLPPPPSGAPQPPYQPTGAQPPAGPPAGQPYAPTTQPMSPADEKLWSTLVHLSPFVASVVGLPFLGPLIIYLVLKDRGPFIRFHAAQALNFQLIVMIGILVSIPLMFVIVGFFSLIVIVIAAFILQIVAAVQANGGQWYRYPMTPDWVK
jgi:uncharacterized protein